jgi:DnaJ-class molecular chaperone
MPADTPDDYYELLGMEADDDDAELRRAWRRLAVRWHPDRAGPRATAMFQRMSAAYTVLSDPAARAAYDRRRGTAAASSSGMRSSGIRTSDTTSAPPSTPQRRAPAVMLSRLSGPLKGLLACGIARRAEGDVIDLFVDDEEATQGGMATISMRVPVHCPACSADPTAPCTRCVGTRSVQDLFSAWLAVRPDVADGTLLTPSAQLPGVLRPVSFRVRRRGPA